MNIAVVAPSPAPFVFGGAERLALGLVEQLGSRGDHQCELIKLPCREFTLPDLMASYRQFHELDLSHFDTVVTMKYPAWMVRHPNHVVYMLHRLRGLYEGDFRSAGRNGDGTGEGPVRRLLELARTAGPVPPGAIFERWEDALARLGPDHPAFAFPGALAKELVRKLDDDALAPGPVARHVAISRTVATRPGWFAPGVPVDVAVPPTPLTGLHTGPFEGFFTASRLHAAKRVELLVDAMRYVDRDTTLTIAGDGPERARLEARADGDPRISFIGFVADDELVARYANALAVPFVPLYEDLGFVTLEAHLSGKPVITCTDSGGCTELVTHGRDGFVVAPDPRAIAAAMTELVDDPARAEHMGREGRAAAQRHTWARVVSALVGATEGPGSGAPHVRRARAHWQGAGRRPGRRRLIVLSTYPTVPALGGGPLRCLHLYRGLTEAYDVDYVAVHGTERQVRVDDVGPGFRQIVVAPSRRYREVEADLHRRTGVPAGDVAAALQGTDSDTLLTIVRGLAADAHAVALAHPYLEPVAAVAAPDLPVIYDAHNAEHVLKDAMLPAGPAGDTVRQVVTDVETRAVRRARAIVACSSDDVRHLRRLGPTLADWFVIPNGGAVAATRFVSGAARAAGRTRWLQAFRRSYPSAGFERVALFVGSDHGPNNDAARALFELAFAFPHVLFVHVGSHCGHFERWELAPNTVLMGVVAPADLAQLLAVADVAVNPVTSGSGTNLKLIEAFAAGVPVAATPAGVRGVDAIDSEHLLVADPADFADAVMAILRDPTAAAQRAVRARRLAEERYDWPALSRRLADVIGAVLADRSVVVR